MKYNVNEKEFWDRVDELNKTTLKEMAESLGIAYKTLIIQRIQERFPRLPDLINIAKYLNTSLDYLVFGERMDIDSSASLNITEITAILNNIKNEIVLVEKALNIKKK